jgi:glucose-6-phosphate 1-dehydrogenase
MTPSRSDALVLFGVTGDLAHKMIFPALYAMAKRGTLEETSLSFWTDYEEKTMIPVTGASGAPKFGH